MLTAYLFDRKQGATVTAWQAAAENLADDQVLWIDLTDPSESERCEVSGAFGLESDDLGGRDNGPPGPDLHLRDGYIHVATMTAPDHGMPFGDAASIVDSFIGRSWVLTSHAADSSSIDDFRELAGGAGQLGALDAPSFLATLLESVVASYADAFSDIEETLEDFDAEVLKSPAREVESKVAVLVEARQRVGELRRALAPHRRVFVTLSHAELDVVSTESSAERFSRLAQLVDDALTSARDAKQAVVNSFDILILRTEHRTNEIVKVLTLTSILLLPGALIAAVMGMNVNLAASDFTGSMLFWAVLLAIVAVAAATLTVARVRQWI